MGCYRHDIEQLLCFSWSHQQSLHFRLPAAHLDHGWVLVWISAARLGELHRQGNSQPCVFVCFDRPPSWSHLSADRGYGTCEIDWSKAAYSTVYRSYIISIFIFCYFIPMFIMLFCYISIINRVKRGNALAAGYLTDRQRKMERDVTIVSLQCSVSAMLIC